MTKHTTDLVTASLAALLAFVAPTPLACADIYQWEYINPADPSQGKEQSMTLAPDGAGVSAEPGAYLSNRDLTMAYLIGADLGPGGFCNPEGNCESYSTNLTGTTLVQADLTDANLIDAVLTNANLSGAEVRGANFTTYFLSPGTGITTPQLYSTASYQAHDLSGIRLGGNNLAGINLVGQNLTNAFFASVDLTGADLTGAEIRGAVFAYAGITTEQLSSTASYQAHDLSGIKLEFNSNNLAGANLAGQNLTNASFYYSDLTEANLTGADVRGANFEASGITAAQLYSTASYQAHDLTGLRLGGDFTAVNLAAQDLTNAVFDGSTLSGANLSQANLTNANFSGSCDDYYCYPGANLTGANLTGADARGANFQYATLTGADLTGTDVRGANFSGGDYFDPGIGLTITQLYSTASYQAHDLPGIKLARNNLSGVDLVGQNLTNTDFYFAALDNANLSGADTRGAQGLDLPPQVIATNLIRPDGHIAGFDLTAGEFFLVRDYDGNPTNTDVHGNPDPILLLPIAIDDYLSIGPGGTLRLVFDADAWDSTISFAPGIPVTLGGVLELTFAPDLNLASQLGRTIDLFDWSGVTPTGAFTISSSYTWDLTKLYTTGEVTLAAAPSFPGDFNLDGAVNAADYVLWRKFGGTQEAYDEWRVNFGATAGNASLSNASVPEPLSVLLLLSGAAAVVCLRCRLVSRVPSNHLT